MLVSDTMMYQRFGGGSSDPELGSFYGLALPLLKHGMPVEPVQIELASLAPYKVLLLTYEGQKPPTPAFHAKLAEWVRGGGALVVLDDDRDPYHAVREWWNTGDANFATPRHHLFDTLGVAHGAEGVHRVGEGVVVYAATSPGGLSRATGGSDRVRALVRQAAEARGMEWRESSALVLRRGPYVVAAGLDGIENGRQPPVLRGRFIPLFDPAMPVVREFRVTPGARALLVDLDLAARDSEAAIVAAACRVTDERVTGESVRFRADGVEGSPGVVCVRLPAAPKGVIVNGEALAEGAGYDYADGVARVRFVNRADPVDVVVRR